MDSKAPPQAGVFSGLNPTAVNPANPITLFIIQVSTSLVQICKEGESLFFCSVILCLGCYHSRLL